MSGNDATRDALVQSYGLAATYLRGVRQEQAHLPTPCTDFDVTALAEHMAGAAERPLHVIGGEEIGELETTSARFDEQADAIERVGTTISELLGDDEMEKEFTLPWGTYRGRALAEMYTMELATHAWDLAAATGQDRSLGDALAEVILPTARRLVPEDEYRGGDMPFGPVVEAPEGAGPADLLACHMGRSVPSAAGSDERY